MYLRCRPPSNAHDLKEVCSSSFSSLAIQLRQHRRHLSQHRGPQPQTQERREARKKARQSLTSHRLFRALSTLPNAPYNVAVIGGGITGLTAAFKISQDPNAKVTLYESSSKLGGWMKETERVKVNGGEVLFEYGPRSFRASTEMGYSTSNLVRMSPLPPLPLSSLDSSEKRAYVMYMIELMVGVGDSFGLKCSSLI